MLRARRCVYVPADGRPSARTTIRPTAGRCQWRLCGDSRAGLGHRSARGRASSALLAHFFGSGLPKPVCRDYTAWEVTFEKRICFVRRVLGG